MRLLLALLLLLPLSGSARIFTTEFPVKSVCWDDIKEAVDYHQDILGEYPVGKGWVSDKSFAAIMFNPVKPSWTLLTFHTTDSGVAICAIISGSQWDILTPGDEGERLEL